MSSPLSGLEYRPQLPSTGTKCGARVVAPTGVVNVFTRSTAQSSGDVLEERADDQGPQQQPHRL